jgi:hypothetical protein
VRRVALFLILPTACAFAAVRSAQSSAPLPPSIVLPIAFVNSIDSAHAKPGDLVEAVTLQRVQLSNGVLPSGARVYGHVVAARRFARDKVPYAAQKPGMLTVHFDAVLVHGDSVPLNVKVRALAGSIATADAADAPSTDLDSLATQTQIGGDQLVPSQTEVRNREGDVVAFNRRNGVYAHLIARGDCDGGNEEVSVAMFSASACGLYGFGDATATNFGSGADPSTLTLVSTHRSPEIWKHSTALLEVLPNQIALSVR